MEGLIDKQIEEYMCSNFLSAAVTKHSDQKQSRERRMYLTCVYRSQTITKGCQGRHSNKNLKQKLGGTSFAGCLMGSCLSSFLKQPRTTSPGHGAGAAILLCQLEVKTITHTQAHRTTWTGRPLHGDSLLCDSRQLLTNTPTEQLDWATPPWRLPSM